jgi:hypothetical protein
MGSHKAVAKNFLEVPGKIVFLGNVRRAPKKGLPFYKEKNNCTFLYLYKRPVFYTTYPGTTYSKNDFLSLSRVNKRKKNAATAPYVEKLV